MPTYKVYSRGGTYLYTREARLRYYPRSAAIGEPKEKIRIEPVEVPVPSKTPAPVETPVETPEKEPVR